MGIVSTFVYSSSYFTNTKNVIVSKNWKFLHNIPTHVLALLYAQSTETVKFSLVKMISQKVSMIFK